MKHFHKPEDEKRSVVVLNNNEYQLWLQASHEEAKSMLKLAPSGFLISEAASLAKLRSHQTTFNM